MTATQEKERAQVGARCNKVVGSVDWCWQTTALAETTFHLAKSSMEQWTTLLDELKAHKPWMKVPKDNPYGDADVWAKAHFGVDKFDAITAEYFKRKADRSNAEANKYKKKPGPKTIESNCDSIHSNASENILRRLARDNPELLDRIEAGELTVNAAAIVAGISKKPTHAEICVKAFAKTETRLDVLRSIAETLKPHEMEYLMTVIKTRLDSP